MPDTRQHRGPGPEDTALFAPAALPVLSDAMRDFSWLLGRGYSRDAALKLVGDRYQLHKRQRTAIGRLSCSEEERRSRDHRRARTITGESLVIDGYNLLTTLEVALSGGPILRAMDGAFRDLAGLSGTYRSVAETGPAIDLITEHLCEHHAAGWTIFLDRPVSNSGRLAAFWRERAGEDADVAVIERVDETLARDGRIAATSDSRILDLCERWYGMAGAIIEQEIPGAWLLP